MKQQEAKVANISTAERIASFGCVCFKVAATLPDTVAAQLDIFPCGEDVGSNDMFVDETRRMKSGKCIGNSNRDLPGLFT
ncbi:MAG: hypothetical protein ACRYF4_05830 [Janthinobacterium lividum]